MLAEPKVASWLDPYYDQRLAWKSNFRKSTMSNIRCRLRYCRWRAPKSGSAGVDFVWTPTIASRPLNHTATGSGLFTVSVQRNQFWNSPNTTAFQTRAGLLHLASDWGVNTTDYAQLTYTHTFPGRWDWLSATIGQYGFGAYDINQYAGNRQTNFMNYALAQNGTQTYVSADLGAYAQAAGAGSQSGVRRRLPRWRPTRRIPTWTSHGPRPCRFRLH